jgi:prophage regulatory protein
MRTVSNVGRLLRLPEVEIEVGLKRSAIYEAIKNGRFPKQIRVGSRAVAWTEKSIEDWKAERLSVSGTTPFGDTRSGPNRRGDGEL